MGKNFKASMAPAMQFINTAPEPERDPAAPDKTESTASMGPAKRKPAAIYGEAKSRRLQLLIKPSTYERLAARAEAERVSVNEMVNILIDSQV